GLGAQILKTTLEKLYRKYKDNPDVLIVGVIHDEIIIECTPQMQLDVAKSLHDLMRVEVNGLLPVILTASPEYGLHSLSKNEKGITYIP
ncbi:MAG: hypothetical protein JXR87_06745, partial [Candidatus Marinimicrobia bacterium]|nr:hypothetical protein [Candidatus Neomarinimicrobiota bacterium]